MGREDARHLLARTGFGGRLEEIDRVAALDRRTAVERLLAGTRTEARTPPPQNVDEWIAPRRVRDLSDDERKMFQREQVERGLALKAWWLQEMLVTDSPLTERMTLFWHNHFTSGLQKVRSSALMRQQNVLLRRHALGSFAELLHAAAKDPAMLLYLDSARSRREQPNENFAREVMELFTLGEGHYSERDIREAARAFTGWSIDPDSGSYRWRPFFHDGGEKTVLGATGRMDGDDVIDVLLRQPATAEFVVRKLWREFASPEPDEAEVRRIASVFRDRQYSIRAALRELLLSPAFWAPENRGTLVKSPVELVVGTLRQFDVGVADAAPFALLLRALGQDLFAPPNVKGWPGGEAWISSQTLLSRKQFAERLMRVDEARMVPAMNDAAERPRLQRMLRQVADLRFSAQDWLKPYEGREADLRLVLLALPPSQDPPPVHGMELVRALVADPVYQLK